MKKLHLLFLSLAIVSSPALLAQSELETKAPTLQIGLDGLSFSQGSLDAQLIMEIVAEKQQELKIKAIQNIFLKKVEDAGATIYSFTDNVVRGLVLEKDQKVRTRKILESTVNLVFVSSYLNYYLSKMDKKQKEQMITLSKLYDCVPEDTTKITLTSFISKNKEKESSSDFQKTIPNDNEIEFIALLLDMCSEVVRKDETLKQLGLMQISYSATYDYMNKYNKVKNDECFREDNLKLYKNIEDTLKLNPSQTIAITNQNTLQACKDTILLKPAQEVLLTGNDSLTSKQIEALANPEKVYEFKDKFIATKKQKGVLNKIQVEVLNNPEEKFPCKGMLLLTGSQKRLFNKDTKNILKNAEKILTCKEKAERAEKVFISMDSILLNITNYIGLINYLVDENSYRNATLELYDTLKVQVINRTTCSTNLGRLKDSIRSIIDSLRPRNFDNGKDSMLIIELNNLSLMYFYIDKAKKVISADSINYKSVADVLYTFHAEFRPILLKQSYRNTKYLDVISEIDSICLDLVAAILYENKQLQEIKSKIDPFLLLVAKLYQFDKAGTISEYLKLIEDVGAIFPDRKVTDALSTVITFVKDYTVIEENGKGDEVVNFNVESFILKLKNVKPYKLNRFQFNMTVGMNNAYFHRDLTLKDGSITRNLSYVSEKVGVKYKFFDWSFWMNRNPGETYRKGSRVYRKVTPPKEPLVSSIHALAYGSGLLYSLVNTKTNEEFNMPLLGAGLGLTFFNALDFNVSYGIPIFPSNDFKKSVDNSFINVGFDIQFVEYYNRLQEKRKFNQTQKKLIKAKKN